MAALTEEQHLLREQAQAWTHERAPVAAFRRMRDANTERCFDSSTWSGISQMGWSGLLVPEQYGGAGMDHLSMGLLLETLGRQLTASPLLASGVAGVSALMLAGNADQKDTWLPGIAAGSHIVTLAVDEGPRHQPGAVALRAGRIGDDYELSGQKVHVLEGMAADAFIVSARLDGTEGAGSGPALFLVEATSEGVQRERLHTADSRGYARVFFDRVRVPRADRMGPKQGSLSVLDAILDRARAALAAEMLGNATQALDMTLDYLKTRVQFGSVIGSFQALGHRAAAMFTQQELTRSCVEAALTAIDKGAQDAPQLCSLAKCKAGALVHHVSNELIQMHGGIGMTDEFDAGFYLKRARAQEATWGNQAFHRDRYATLLGF